MLPAALTQRWKYLLIAAGVLLAGAILFYQPLLTAAGGYLVQSTAPVNADAIFVLAGDSTGLRILKAGELVRDGFAPVAIVSGPAGYFGVHECELAIPFAVERGFPEEYFAHFENEALSTEHEAAFAAEEIRRRGIQHVLIVTSNYHTRRARYNFERAMPGIEITMVAAPDLDFTPDGWWRNRQAQKKFFYEWSKTVATWFGI